MVLIVAPSIKLLANILSMKFARIENTHHFPTNYLACGIKIIGTTFYRNIYFILI